MDIHTLDGAVQKYFAAALTSSTHKTYSAAELRYTQFCKEFDLSPFPVTENVVCYFVACLGQQNLAHSTIKTYLSGVRQAQISLGLPEPSWHLMPRLRQVIRGVQVMQGKKGKTPKPRLPITPCILRKLKSVWTRGGAGSYEQALWWATATTTFFTFCRLGEVILEKEVNYDPNSHLSLRDVAADRAKDPTMISLMLRCSKTDQVRKGTKLVMGRTGDDLCPVAALLDYLAQRGSQPGPLFINKDGRPLLKAKFITVVRAALTAAKLPAASYAGHSFRIGAATTAAAAGFEDSMIQTLGRWQSTAYLLYVKMDLRQLAAVSSSLAKCVI